jgi:glyceraldehyde-3-phosphate dehydrogenase (NADP+)
MEMLVAGRRRAGAAMDEVLNPDSGEVVDVVPRATAEDAEEALAAAVEGAKAMRRLSPHDRAAIVTRAADLIEEGAEEFARTITAEEGKPLAEAMTEATRTPLLLRMAASEAARMHGETIPIGAAPGNEDKLGFTLREPCGVVVAITPFNYPLLLVAHKVGPALAAGNAVILKPASMTPLTALRLTDVFLEAGLPELALQCITGPGGELGAVLCADPRVRKISFTGSTAVGDEITRVAGVKRLSLELGSNCPLVVLPDADVEAVAAATALGGYANAGQACISVQRVLVDRGVYGDYVDALRPKVEALAVGDPLADDTKVSALITEAEADRVASVIGAAVSDGASLVTGGTREGGVVAPAVIADVSPAMEISRKELFGPAVAVTPVSGIDEAIAYANDSGFGLGAGIFTQDVTSALRFAREVESGNVQINQTPLWRADVMPYGGLKGSGIGKEGPRYAVEEMTELKAVVFHGLTP